LTAGVIDFFKPAMKSNQNSKHHLGSVFLFIYL